MALENGSPRKVTTPPKGRPTPARHAPPRRRVFGATARWIALVAAIVITFVVLFVLTGGGDFNPNNAPAENSAATAAT